MNVSSSLLVSKVQTSGEVSENDTQPRLCVHPLTTRDISVLQLIRNIILSFVELLVSDAQHNAVLVWWVSRGEEEAHVRHHRFS